VSHSWGLIAKHARNNDLEPFHDWVINEQWCNQDHVGPEGDNTAEHGYGWMSGVGRRIGRRRGRVQSSPQSRAAVSFAAAATRPRPRAPGPAAIHVVYRDSIQRRDRTLPYPQRRRLQGAGEGGGAIVPTGEKRLGHRPALCLTKRCGNFYSVAPGRNGFACGFVCVSVEHMRTWNYQDYRRVYHARGSGESLRCTVALLKHILNLFPNALKHA